MKKVLFTALICFASASSFAYTGTTDSNDNPGDPIIIASIEDDNGEVVEVTLVKQEDESYLVVWPEGTTNERLIIWPGATNKDR